MKTLLHCTYYTASVSTFNEDYLYSVHLIIYKMNAHASLCLPITPTTLPFFMIRLSPV